MPAVATIAWFCAAHGITWVEPENCTPTELRTLKVAEARARAVPRPNEICGNSMWTMTATGLSERPPITSSGLVVSGEKAPVPVSEAPLTDMPVDPS